MKITKPQQNVDKVNFMSKNYVSAIVKEYSRLDRSWGIEDSYYSWIKSLQIRHDLNNTIDNKMKDLKISVLKDDRFNRGFENDNDRKL